MSAEVSAVIEPLIKRKIFLTEEQAVRELLREYILRQITALQREIARFERRYGMHFERFGEYLHEDPFCWRQAVSQQNNVRLWAGPSWKRKTTGWIGR